MDGKKFGDPARSFAKKTGWTSRYLEYELDGKRCLKVGYKNNAMTFFRDRAGIFIMLTPSTEWETVMAAYNARNSVETAFGIFKNEPDRRYGRTGDPVRAQGRLLIKFLALMIGVRMQIAVLKAKVKNLTAENALMSASTYETVKGRGVNVRSEKTKRVRDIFWVFRVEDPAYPEPDPQSL